MTATSTATRTPLAASAAVRLPNATTRRRVGWFVGLSVLLHLALLVLAIVAAQHKRILPQSVPPASVAMVFEGGGNTPPSIANPAPVSPNQQASPQPQPAIPPPPLPAPPVEQPPPTAPPPEIPPAPEVVPPPPEIVPPPQEVAPPAQEVVPPPPEIVPPAPEVAPPEPAPQATPQPLPEIGPPPSAAPAVQAPAPEAVPLPPPVPAPEAAPQPAPPRPLRPREAVRPVSPPRAPGPAFPAPTDFSLGPRTVVPEATPQRPRASPGTLDLSFAPTMGGGDITQLHPQGKGDDVGEDWFNEVAAWWLRHRFYPSEAGRLQQEGDVMLRLVVGRDGRVQAVRVEQKSGSPWLDLGALAVFRDAKLPPLPPDVSDPNVTVDFTIHYVILR